MRFEGRNPAQAPTNFSSPGLLRIIRVDPAQLGNLLFPDFPADTRRRS